MEYLWFFMIIIYGSLIRASLSNSENSSKSIRQKIDMKTDINELKWEMESLKQELGDIRKLKDDVKVIKETINNQDNIADKVIKNIKSVHSSVKIQMDEFDRVIDNLDVNLKMSALNFESRVETLENKIMDFRQEISVNLTEMKYQLNACNITVSSTDASQMILRQIQENLINLQKTQEMLETFMERVNVALRNTNNSINMKCCFTPESRIFINIEAVRST